MGLLWMGLLDAVPVVGMDEDDINTQWNVLKKPWKVNLVKQTWERNLLCRSKGANIAALNRQNTNISNPAKNITQM